MALSHPSSELTSIVTGASAGIGVEFADELARRGHGLTLVARRRDRLDELAETLRSRHGVRVEVIPADLTDVDARRQVVEQVQELGLHINLLVNNAGLGTVGPVAVADPDTEVRMMRTNVEAVVHLCTLVTPLMVARRRGAILNVASTAAFQPLPAQAGYAASKAFVLSYTHALRGELAGCGVSVTALCPGPVRTEFFEAAGYHNDEVDGNLPEVMWVDATTVARQGIDGAAAGRPVVIPGFANKAASSAAWLAPRRILIPLLTKGHPGMRRMNVPS